MDNRDNFFSEIRRFFEEFTAFANMLASGGAMPMPSASNLGQPHEDAIETDSEYIITLELPGASASDIRVNSGKRVIEVEAYDSEEEGLAFQKSYPTQADIKPNELKLTYKNGVLEVRAPKKTQVKLR